MQNTNKRDSYQLKEDTANANIQKRFSFDRIVYLENPIDRFIRVLSVKLYGNRRIGIAGDDLMDLVSIDLDRCRSETSELIDLIEIRTKFSIFDQSTLILSLSLSHSSRREKKKYDCQIKYILIISTHIQTYTYIHICKFFSFCIDLLVEQNRFFSSPTQPDKLDISIAFCDIPC